MTADGLLDIAEAAADSPRFRTRLRELDGYATTLETSIQGLAKATRQLHASSQDYHARLTDVTQRVSALTRQSPVTDTLAEQTLRDYATLLAEIERNRLVQSEQLQQIVVQPLLDAIDGGLLQRVRQGRRQMDALQTDYESQLARLMGRRAAEPQLEQHERDVDAAKTRYVQQVQVLALDYNRMAAVQRADVLESYLSLMYAQYAYHHQAYSSLRDFEPAMRRLGEHIAGARSSARAHIDEARAQVAEHPADRGSVDGSGYMQVGQHDDDLDPAPDASTADPPGDAQLSAHTRSSSRSKRRSLASISLSPHGQFQMAGYLFLRSQYSLMASWQRRWFEIRAGALVHFQHDARDHESVPLHLCMVKRGAHADNRRNVFELIAPNRTYVLQAESADELRAWKACLQQAIEASLYAHNPAAAGPDGMMRAASQPVSAPTSPVPSKVGLHTTLSTQPAAGSDPAGGGCAQAQRLHKLRQPRGNRSCVDCGRADPEWAAINLGALMCIECSGIHRSLGVHVSKVRSVKLDNWEPELMQIMLRLGNARVNRVYEARGVEARPTAGSLREDKQPFLQRKYADRAFVAGGGESSAEQLAARLVHAAATADLPRALQALAQGASANAHDPASGRTPLTAAVSMGDFGMLELLLQWGADVNQRTKISATAYASDTSPTSDTTASDSSGFGGTALHLAVRLGNVRVVWYLVRRGAHWDTPDAYGLLPLDIALEQSNVQVVMALRYAAFQKASGLPPGTLGARRNNGQAEPVDMLDIDDSFIRDWAIPPYSPYIDAEQDDASEAGDNEEQLQLGAIDEGDVEFGELQTAAV